MVADGRHDGGGGDVGGGEGGGEGGCRSSKRKHISLSGVADALSVFSGVETPGTRGGKMQNSVVVQKSLRMLALKYPADVHVVQLNDEYANVGMMSWLS
ncbi:hypothetical protein M8C21_009394 [Ambrosia artemisiifolia]|uniref:Uncharacterized protein n=1 Tax=Ambrosia artemisiifolia TaxID=4212 RepID=A0AAD5CPM3_AMBAR|nr:hypothetical protein M8C21_009394 [Ambrosia artemisiifolia]